MTTHLGIISVILFNNSRSGINLTFFNDVPCSKFVLTISWHASVRVKIHAKTYVIGKVCHGVGFCTNY